MGLALCCSFDPLTATGNEARCILGIIGLVRAIDLPEDLGFKDDF